MWSGCDVAEIAAVTAGCARDDMLMSLRGAKRRSNLEAQLVAVRQLTP
jgi:hypothetical protein